MLVRGKNEQVQRTPEENLLSAGSPPLSTSLASLPYGHIYQRAHRPYTVSQPFLVCKIQVGFAEVGKRTPCIIINGAKTYKFNIAH